jgi:hypothetical protein
MKSFKIPSKKGNDVIRKGTTDNPLINLETYFDFILLILIILVISTQKSRTAKLYFNLCKHQRDENGEEGKKFPFDKQFPL